MEYMKLGNSDLNVSRICLGCMGFGDATQGMHKWTVDENYSKEIIRKALELGINFFDTALGYQNGTSEQFVGQSLKQLIKRDEVIVATKFPARTEDAYNSGVSVRNHINRCLDKSLKNLGMDYVDLYIYHIWDDAMSIEEVMETMNDTVIRGKVRCIGVSNCYAWQLQKANDIAQRQGWSKFISVQGHYNLLFREEEREMIPCCKDGNIALTPYSPLASGRLVKSISETSKRLSEDSFAKSKYDGTNEKDSIIINRVAELAEKKNMTRTQIALGWLLHKVTAPIVGATKISHIEEAVKAVSVCLSEEELYYLEEPYVPHALVGVMRRN